MSIRLMPRTRREKNPFINKLTDIKYNHGALAREYFLKHPKCSRCSEKRIGCLQLHHVHGKEHEVFETLCANCHELHHSHRKSSYTYDHFRAYIEQKIAKENKIKERNRKIMQYVMEGLSDRAIGKLVGLSCATVWYIKNRKK